MPSPSIQDLLGLPTDVTQPNPYQLFGLELGESDQATIDSAIAQRIADLKQAKANAAPDTWKRAALAVQAAQRILKDSAKKSELDASFGIVNESKPLTAPVVAADPLAMLLPTGSPAAAQPPSGVSHTSSASLAPARAVPASPAAANPPAAIQATAGGMPPTVQPVPPIAQAANPIPAATAPQTPAVIQAPAEIRSIKRRPIRRRKNWGGFILGLLALLILGSVVAGLGYFVMYGPGQVEFVQTDDGFRIKTGGSDKVKKNTIVNRARVGSERFDGDAPKGDGIMRPISGRPSNSDRPRGPGLSRGELDRAQPSNAQMSSNGMSSTPSNKPVPKTQPEPPQPEPPKPEPPKPEPPEPKPLSEAEITDGANAIQNAREAIRKANWKQMKSLAEQAESKAATPSQKLDAETIFQFADLATFYRGAVEQALMSLSVNSEIKITKTRNVLVMEADANHLKVMLGKNNYKEYTLDELPFVIANEIASYKLNTQTPDKQAQSIAAKAAFQAIAAPSTPGHRKESVEMLRGLASVPGADPKRLANFLESLDR